ncbi:helix-turn-helix domain-containing protein [Halobacillus ihumii]|uniref:helix-turn-helix domain-containing protein n=1 Tax=Halobacillus ihumii TaxID=2686092 RepID=UPI0013D0DEF8|nr:helix-turn-helix transcriptional regulator [Halobacillus ihumii]
MELDEKIGQRLKKERKKKGYTLREAGNRLGKSHSYMSQIENGKIPSLQTLEKLCAFYDIELSSLFGKEAEKPEGLDVEWIAFNEELKKEKITPQEAREYIEIVKTLRKLNKNE